MRLNDSCLVEISAVTTVTEPTCSFTQNGSWTHDLLLASMVPGLSCHCVVNRKCMWENGDLLLHIDNNNNNFITMLAAKRLNRWICMHGVGFGKSTFAAHFNPPDHEFILGSSSASIVLLHSEAKVCSVICADYRVDQNTGMSEWASVNRTRVVVGGEWRRVSGNGGGCWMPSVAMFASSSNLVSTFIDRMKR